MYTKIVYMENVKRTRIQEMIDKVAREYIFHYGVKGWNMDEFAKEAGITKRTLYNYVGSKEQLIENTLLDYIREIQNKLGKEFENVPDFETGIEKVLDIYPQMIMKMDSRVVQEILKNYPSIEETVVKERQSFTQDILKFVERGQEEGRVDESYDSTTILQVLQSLIIYYIKNQPEHIESKVKKSISIVMYGIIRRKK